MPTDICSGRHNAVGSVKNFMPPANFMPNQQFGIVFTLPAKLRNYSCDIEVQQGLLDQKSQLQLPHA